MNYDDEIYAYIKANPGCKTIDIGRYLEELIESEPKGLMVRFLSHFPAFQFLTVPMITAPQVFFSIEYLERGGFIRTEKDENNKIRCYPTGKHRPYETSEVSFNPVTA